jgi:hypothetical protein
MPDPIEAFTEPIPHGALMADPTDPRLEELPTGEPMPDPTDISNEATTHGEPMSDEDEPTTDGEPMPDATDMPNETSSHGDPMTDDDTLPGFPPVDFARAHLSSVATALGHDEVRVLTRIAERLRGGRDAYGPLDLATDTREFRSKEAREELEDALVYLACAWLKTETRNLEVNR